MADLYEVYLHDDVGVKQALLVGWEYLEFTQRISAPWNHDIRFNISPDDLGNSRSLVNLLLLQVTEDWIIKIKRTDSITGEKTTVYEGLNRTVVDQSPKDGSLLINLYGKGYTELLERRIIIPPTGLDSSDKNGTAETIIKEYVDEQAVNPISAYSPLVPADRVIEGLSIQPTTGQGGIVSYSGRNVLLSSAVSKIAKDGGVDFGIIQGTTPGSYVLRVAPLWGEDKTVFNGVGRNPVVFDYRAGNMEIPIHSRNSSEERNIIYVGGQGEGVNREIYTLVGNGYLSSVINKREAFVDARREKTSDGLRLEANDYHDRNKAKDTLTFNALQTNSVRWPTHWGLGDIVTSRYYGREWQQKVEEVTVRLSGGSASGSGMHEYISAEMRIVDLAWLLGIANRTELGLTTTLG